MKLNFRSPLFCAVLALAAFLLAACDSSDGPLLINTSGKPIRLVVHSADGSTFDGECEDQSAVWVGKAKTTVSRIEIFVGEVRYELKGEELTLPYGKDRTTAFIVEASGPRKLALAEAKILMRGR